MIVDDEPLARARLAALLAECESVEIVASVDDGETALNQLDALQPEVMLLDINMPGIDGISVAQRLAARSRIQVIFCTAYEAYALKAFDLGAADYLLKPVRLERLREALQRAQRRLADIASEPTVWLHGRLRGEEKRIALEEVTCLIAEEKYVCVHHHRGQLLIEESLRQLEDAHPDQLIRLHRNCLVPPARLIGIKTLPDNRVLAQLEGSEISPEISRRNLPAVRKLLRLG